MGELPGVRYLSHDAVVSPSKGFGPPLTTSHQASLLRCTSGSARGDPEVYSPI
jgi:hypothetical protein